MEKDIELCKEIMENHGNEFLHYEPKRSFRWVVECDNIPSYVFKKFKMPVISAECESSYDNNIEFVLYDPVKPSMSERVFEWIKSEEQRNVYLNIIDPTGKAVERWEIYGVFPFAFEVSEFDYSKSDAIEIKVFACFSGINLRKL